MDLDILKDINRERFKEIAIQLMNNYCILKKDSRDNNDVIYRFAEIEFYLYDANEPNRDVYTYNRDCKCIEWFFHGSGVDIAFETILNNDELIRFGGILIRSIEIYKKNKNQQWEQIGVIGGPKLAMYEIFNHCIGMPDIISIPNALKKDRKIGNATKRIGINDSLYQRFVFNDINWNIPTERIIEEIDSDEKYHVLLKKTLKKYNPKP